MLYLVHYSDVLTNEMATQITGVPIVCSTVCSKLSDTGLCEGNSHMTGSFGHVMMDDRIFFRMRILLFKHIQVVKCININEFEYLDEFNGIFIDRRKNCFRLYFAPNQEIYEIWISIHCHLFLAAQCVWCYSHVAFMKSGCRHCTFNPYILYGMGREYIHIWNRYIWNDKEMHGGSYGESL